MLSVTGPEETPAEMVLIPQVSCPEMTNPNSPQTSARSSPESEAKNEELYHKKFDKLRKHTTHSAPDETRKMENLSIHDVENMESDSQEESAYAKNEKSVGDAHPQLLAQLKSGPQFQPNIHPAFPPSSYQQFQSPAAMTINGSQYEAVKKHENGTLPNVALTVPQGPYRNRSSPSHSPTNCVVSTPSVVYASSSSKTKCLESMLRNDTSPRSNNEHFLGIERSKISKFPSAENLSKGSENEFIGCYQNGHAQSAQPMMAAFQSRGFDPAAVQHHMALYPQMYSQQRGHMMPQQYNQHLAGMQQLVYGNPQQIRRGSGGDMPLNLTHGPMYSEPSETPSGGDMIQNIKEEIITSQ